MKNFTIVDNITRKVGTTSLFPWGKLIITITMGKGLIITITITMALTGVLVVNFRGSRIVFWYR